MSSAWQLLDTAGRRRSPAMLPEFHAGSGMPKLLSFPERFGISRSRAARGR